MSKRELSIEIINKLFDTYKDDKLQSKIYNYISNNLVNILSKLHNDEIEKKNLSTKINDFIEDFFLEDNSYFDKFYIFEPSYSPWCMDINLINYAVNEIGAKMENMKDILTLPVSNFQIGEFMKIYFEKQTTLIELLSDEELKIMKENMMNYFLEMEKSSGGISKLRWKQVVGELSKYYKSWDVYSVSICYLSLIKSLNLEMLVKEAPFILEFTKLLKTIIVSSPDKRADAESVIGELKKIKTISKEELENLATSIKKKRENQEEMLMMKNIYIDSKQKYDLEKLKNQEE